MNITIDVWFAFFAVAIIFILGLVAGARLTRPRYY
jgi:hypothetical protein